MALSKIGLWVSRSSRSEKELQTIKGIQTSCNAGDHWAKLYLFPMRPAYTHRSEACQVPAIEAAARPLRPRRLDDVP